MRSVFAIAHLTIRSALRLRVFVSLFLFLVAMVVLVPRSLTGDGSAAGEVRILLTHTLGVAAITLGLATLWAACAAISLEIDGKQMRLLAVKPVRHPHLWVGKWLGIVTLNAVLLLCVAAALGALVIGTLHASRHSEEERADVRENVLTARLRCRPEPLDIAADVERHVAILRSRGQVPADTSGCELFDEVASAVKARRNTIPPGTEMRRTFTLAAQHTARPLSLRYRLRSARGAGRIAGTWYVGSADNPRAFAHEVRRSGGPRERIDIPAGVARPGEPVVVTFAARARPRATTAVLAEDGLELLVDHGGFGGNYLRALLIVWCVLAGLAALGVTAGALFSFPVAAFAATATAIAILVAHVFAAAPAVSHEHHHHHPGHEYEEQTPSLTVVLGESGLRAVAWFARPVAGSAPLTRLCDGVAIPWTRVGHVAVAFAAGYPLALCLLGVLCLRRRELAA